MKAQHLRIGNLVTWADQEDESKAILTLTGIVLGDCIWLEWEWEDGKSDNTDCDLESIKPIPLTEEWLLNFGFEKSEISSTIDSWHNHSMAVNTYSKSKVDYYWLRWYQHNKSSRIKYVHELQNLYYALTKKELTL